MTINNNNIFGVFTLGEVRSGRLTGDWLNKESVANYGWFGGGSTPGPVDRIDFSNDSANATARGSLTATRYYLAATGNSNYGWFGGGSIPNKSIVERVDFSNDAATASPRGPLSLSRFALSVTGNSNYGWFGGGSDPGPDKSTVDRIDFSNDSSTASVRGSLSLNRRYFNSTGNSNYGWFGGGAPTVSTVDRIDFSNDIAIASPRSPLSLARYLSGATGNSNYGWFGGGTTGAPVVSTVDRIDFSNDSTIASVRGLLSSARYRLAATGNSNYGWFGGGNPGPGVIIDRIDFSNDSVQASPRGSLDTSRNSHAATSGVLNIRRQKAGNYGWFGGGVDSSFNTLATVDRINFSNDSVTALARGTLSLPKYGFAATGNSNYGWFGGGAPPSAAATVDRIDFSNDSVTASRRGPLSSARYYLAATGNSNYGWFGGGKFSPGPAPLTTYFNGIERVNFSNDLTIASPRGLLSQARSQLAATGNSNYGWFGGGSISPAASPPAVATVDRIDFSNDSVTASRRGSLSLARSQLAATGNSNYGWFGGGFAPSFQSYTRVDRIDFSNDSTAASVRGPLNPSLGRGGLAATGNSNYGWFGGGDTPGPTYFSIVDRIDFSNDSATALVRGSITPATGRTSLAATSNTNK
jgi:hypothetical protein